ncbi:MAG: metFprotein [Proteobacteria bacterium]|nr:metFprotein [Pseudomonadota bacterium]
MTGFTAETTPGSAAKIPDYREHLRPGTVVYITFLPGSDFDDTIAVAKRLKGEGFLPVPHFAARSIPSAAFLEDKLARLAGEVGLEQVLVIGGSADKPVGDFPDTMRLLETGLFDKHGIRKFGVAGHPEGSPDISDEAIAEALRWKNDFAERSGAELYLVTQFCFEAGPVIAWDRRIRAEGNRLPIHVGVPGLATIKTLLAHAKACGIGPSMKFLTRQARNLTKLMTVSAPDRLVTDLAAYQASDPGCGIAGVHMYPLGGLRRSAKWSYAVIDGAFTMNEDGKGFSVDIDLG